MYATLTTVAVPEPSTWAMILVGLAGLGVAGYRTTKGARTFWLTNSTLDVWRYRPGGFIFCIADQKRGRVSKAIERILRGAVVADPISAALHSLRWRGAMRLRPLLTVQVRPMSTG